MSVPAFLKDTKHERKSFEVPEWVEDGKPVVVYYGPWRAIDTEKLNRKHPKWTETMTVNAFAEAIIMRAERQDGEPMFGPDAKEYLMRQPSLLIHRVAGTIMTGGTVEEQEKN